jgi:hypothetical protein
VARLYSGQRNGLNTWRAFIRAYLPHRMHEEREVKRLNDGLRNALSHEYGTRDVLLTHANSRLHWTLNGGARILDLNSLLDEFEAAFEKFYADLKAEPALRARVVPQVQGLLVPIIVQVPPEHPDDDRITLLATMATKPWRATRAGGAEPRSTSQAQSSNSAASCSSARLTSCRYTERGSRWLRSMTGRLARRLRRLVGRSRPQVVHLGVADEVNVADSLSVRLSIKPDASLEEQVAYLLRREQEAQTKLNAHNERLHTIDGSLAETILTNSAPGRTRSFSLPDSASRLGNFV